MTQCLTPDQFVNFLNLADLWSLLEIVNAVHIRIHATAGAVDWFKIGETVCLGGIPA